MGGLGRSVGDRERLSEEVLELRRLNSVASRGTRITISYLLVESGRFVFSLNYRDQ